MTTRCLFKPDYRSGHYFPVLASAGVLITQFYSQPSVERSRSVWVCNIGSGALYFKVGTDFTPATSDPNITGVLLMPGLPNGFNPASAIMIERDLGHNQFAFRAVADTVLYFCLGEGG